MSNRPFKTYNGGKNGSGVYQAIINEIPPHKVFISMFGGNCGVMANKKKAAVNIITDLDQKVIEGWNKIESITAIKADAISYFNYLCRPSADGAGTFVFADPPYLRSVRVSQQKLYDNEMTDPAAHKKLLLAMVNYKCNVCINHYPCELYDSILKGWRKVEIIARSRAGIKDHPDCLYMNYPAPTALHDYKFIGKDFREREEYKKMQKNMVAKFARMS